MCAGYFVCLAIRVQVSFFVSALTDERSMFSTILGDRAALQTAQIVLGQDSPEWGSSNIMPAPTGDISLYRGKLKIETANFIKTSRCNTTPSYTMGHFLCRKCNLDVCGVQYRVCRLVHAFRVIGNVTALRSISTV